MPNTVKRRIYTYDYEAIYHEVDDGNAKSLPSDMASIFNYIDTLPYSKSAEPNAYQPVGFGKAVSVRIFDVEEDYITAAIGRTLYDDLPQLEGDGIIEILDGMRECNNLGHR